jgi:hypothetical protein
MKAQVCLFVVYMIICHILFDNFHIPEDLFWLLPKTDPFSKMETHTNSGGD